MTFAPASEFRTYFTESVEAAVALARGDLGEEAVLLGSRKTRPEEAAAGQYEVRFAPPETVAEETKGDEFAQRIAAEVSELRRQLASMHQVLSKSVLNPPRWLAPSSALAGLLSALIRADVDGELAQEIVDAVHLSSNETRPDGQHSLADLARKELARRLLTAPTIGTAEMGRRIVALVGPPGAGKTTTLVKLAVHFGLSARRSVHLITTDDYRVGGAEQLRSFAAILGVGFQVAATPSALAQALEENRTKDLVLIDTPGIGHRDMDDSTDLARFLRRRSDIDSHLVLMSSMKSADLNRVWEAFQMFQPAKLILSRTDETDALGGMYTLAVRSRTPVSFLTTGQRIPEDLAPATPGAIVDRLLTCKQLHMEAAA
jgi:flagellar biosynthesis protein FlhF